MSRWSRSSKLTRGAFAAVVLLANAARGEELANAARGEDAVSANSQAAPPRLQLGTLLGSVGSNKLSVDGREQGDEGGGWIAGVSAAYSHGLVPHFSVVGLMRVASESTDWAQARDEQRIRFDLAVGPELWWFVGRRRPSAAVRLSVPAGPTWTSFQAGEGGPVDERYSAGHGFNIGGVGGLDVTWGHHGFSMEAAYLRHITYMTREGTLVRDPTVTGSEEYRFDQTSFVLGCGYAYRF